MCSDCDQGAAIFYPEIFQEYYLVLQNLEEWDDTYLSRDKKWSLYYDSASSVGNGWRLGFTDDLGKSLLHAPDSSVDCPSHVGYSILNEGYWTYFDPINNEFVDDDGLNVTCLCGKRSFIIRFF